MSKHTLHIDPMDEFFNPKMKRKIYGVTALIIGLIMTIEDFTEADFHLGRIFLEFIIFVPVLFILFTLFGFLFQKSIHWFRRQAFFAKWNIKELGFIVFWAIIASFSLFLLAYLIYINISWDEDDSSFFDATWGVWVATLIFISVVILIEMFAEILIKRKKLEEQNRRLMQSHEMAKYQALMNQINPHFLFNSLNVLSYLVHKNPNDAERFIEELSKIYRYILQLNETYIVPLKKELEFIESYIFLQKIRFQNNLVFESKIDIQSLQKLIPPLTLELLVENAIKHNVVSEKQPLIIKLSTQNGHLIVENNLQLRMENEVLSHQIGLKNLSEKFEILEAEAPQFFTKNQSFIAKIPLLKPELP